MHLNIISVFSLQLLASVAAIPSTFPPRACTTVVPSLISSLWSNDSNSSYPNTLSTVPGGSSTLDLKSSFYKELTDYRELQFFSFPIPANSSTCTLGITDRIGSLRQNINGTHSHNTTLKVDFIEVAPNSFRASPSYSEALAANTNATGAKFFAGLDMKRGESVVLGSEACPQAANGLQVEHWQFILKLVEAVPGYEGWSMVQQIPDAAGLVALNGVYLAVDC